MQKMSKNNWNSFKIVPQGHHNCQLSIVNCQFGRSPLNLPFPAEPGKPIAVRVSSETAEQPRPETGGGRGGLLLGGEFVLAYAAEGAGEVLGQILELDAGLFLVIDPAADVADILHGSYLLSS